MEITPIYIELIYLNFNNSTLSCNQILSNEILERFSMPHPQLFFQKYFIDSEIPFKIRFQNLISKFDIKIRY